MYRSLDVKSDGTGQRNLREGSPAINEVPYDINQIMLRVTGRLRREPKLPTEFSHAIVEVF
jgi:hypothetical protein